MKIKKISKFRLAGRVSAALGLGLLLISSTQLTSGTASAVGSTCQSITDCTQQINATTSQVGQLKNQAVSYKDAISRLQSTIANKQGEISTSQSQQADLERQISDAEQKINDQTATLTELLRVMYQEGNVSLIEQLATSDSLSDYVNKEESRNSVESHLKDSIDSITALKAKLSTQKQEVASLLSQQRSQAASLAQDRAAQSSMLDYNLNQQSSYNALTAANQSKLQALIAAQRSANNSSKGGYYFLRFPGSVGGFNAGSYPYKNAGFGMSTAPGCTDNDGPDEWGYCTRQCVSYAAWAVQASGRKAPRYYGNAKNWVAKARANGVLVSNTPQRGDVAISTAGTWGHAMYVESVSGNYINVSQYNQQLNGQFSTQSRKWQ